MRRVWEAWKRIGRKIGDVQARFLLTGFYFLVLGPFAKAVQWTSDPLAINSGGSPGDSRGWRMRTEHGSPAERASKQF